MTRSGPRWLPYDWFKLVVALVLLLLLVVFRGAPPVAPDSPTPLPPTAPLPSQTPEPPPPAVSVTLDQPSPDDPLTSGPNTFSGTASGGALVRVLSNGEPQGESPLSSAGQWRVDADLPEGRHVIVAQALDDAGNVLAETAAQTFIVEPAAAFLPSPKIDSPTAADVLRAGAVAFTGTTAPGTAVSLYSETGWLADAQVDAAGNWTAAAVLPEGALALWALASDPASGLFAQSATLELTILPVLVEEEPTVPSGPCAEGRVTRAGYVVAPCENLTRISERLGVTLAQLLAANPQITDPNIIYPGQILIIP
jgi:LysM repeat protein